MYLYVYENEWPNFSFSSTPLHKFCNNLLLFRLFYRNQLQMKKKRGAHVHDEMRKQQKSY